MTFLKDFKFTIDKLDAGPVELTDHPDALDFKTHIKTLIA